MPSSSARDGSSRLVLLRLTWSEDYLMVSWFQRKPSSGPAKPETNPANPGVGVKASVAFAQADKAWTEEVDVVAVCGYP
jgi:hypothetical protein